MPIKNNLSNIFSELNSESSVILPKYIKIKNIKDLDTISNATSSYSDATSSFMPQKGGYFVDSNKDINQLLSMLSATSENNYTTNSTDTEQLKNKLFNITQEGSAINDKLRRLKHFMGIYSQSEYFDKYMEMITSYATIIEKNELSNDDLNTLHRLYRELNSYYKYFFIKKVYKYEDKLNIKENFKKIINKLKDTEQPYFIKKILKQLETINDMGIIILQKSFLHDSDLNSSDLNSLDKLFNKLNDHYKIIFIEDLFYNPENKLNIKLNFKIIINKLKTNQKKNDILEKIEQLDIINNIDIIMSQRELSPDDFIQLDTLFQKSNELKIDNNKLTELLNKYKYLKLRNKKKIR